MRMFRLITGLIALALLAATLTTTLTSSANAAAPAQAKPRHVLKNVNGGEIRNTGRFFVKGKAVTAKNKRIVLQRAKCEKCKFRNAGRSDRSSRTGFFRITFDGPKGTCYRVVVPATRRYRAAKDVFGCIV